MEIFLIVLLVLLGLFLIVAEILLLPGVTVFAIGSAACFIGAIAWTYTDFGLKWALILLFISLVLIVATLVLSVRSKTLKKISLESNIDSVANISADKLASVGDTGLTITRLAPMGTVTVNNNYIEAKSLDGYIDPKKEIEVAGFDNTIVLVKLKK